MARYPIGKQDFKTLREGGYLYADKTPFIIKLLEDSEFFFLARPRRFGKSLFLSTLEYFFRGERELFKGLAIDSYPHWDWEPHPVIRLDLGLGSYSEKDSLVKTLEFSLANQEERFEISNSNLNIYNRFENLIRRVYEKTGRKVVVLVDEYEKPVIDMLDRPEIMDHHREVLRGFYSVLKGMDGYLRMVFLTGVSKFGQMSVFSGLNNLNDISLTDRYNAICGITEEELHQNFLEGIEKLAEESETDYEGALHLLKAHYDGYHFSKKCPDIYNPFSLINALADSTIRSYWSSTGTPQMLVKLLLQKNYELQRFNDLHVSASRLTGVNNRLDDPVALFYQTGYLTIKSYDKDLELYELGFPNREVEEAFLKFILPQYYINKNVDADDLMVKLVKAFYEGNPLLAMQLLEEFSAGISYDITPKPEVERHFQYLMYIVIKLLLYRKGMVKVEEKTSDGRIDLLVETANYVYIIEIKRDLTPGEAVRQIVDKQYALQFRHDERKVFLIGVNFSTEKKRIDGFLIEEYEYTE